MAMRRRALLVMAALGPASAMAVAALSTLEAARIERLLQYVESQRDAKFVRNGMPYSGKEAAMFLRAKLEKMGEHVGTARQFIDQIASKSSTSGEVYLIRFADGRIVPSAQFLGDELERMDRRP